MRSADAATLFRVFLAVVAVALVLIKFNPWIIFLIILIERVTDALDGYFARRDVSKETFGFGTYVKGAVFGDPAAKKLITKYNAAMQKAAPYGGRFDIAGDRAVEYIFWALYSFLGIVPLFVFILVIIRHSFVDALMGAKGTASKMKSRLTEVVYSGNFARFMINVPKVATFAYLAFVYIYGWPLWIGYVLIAILVIWIYVRGIAEVYEAFA